MQNWIIRYVEDLKARIEPTGCSIAKALEAELPTYSWDRLVKLREAAEDLDRILALEMSRRVDLVEGLEGLDQDRRPDPVPERRLRLRVYHNGTIVAHVDAPRLARTLSRSSFSGWLPVLELLKRCDREWAGLTWDVGVHHQGVA